MSFELDHVMRFGEKFCVLRDEPVVVHMSIKRSTNASFSPSLRESSWMGTAQASEKLKSGEHMERSGDLENGKPPVFLVCSVNAYPHAPDLSEVYLLKSNVRAAIYRKIGEGVHDKETGVWRQGWSVVHKNIPAYMSIETRSLNKINAGMKDQSIYTIDLSKTYGLEPLDRLIIVDAGITFDFPDVIKEGDRKNSVFLYQADSIDYASYVGLAHTQLDRDLRE